MTAPKTYALVTPVRTEMDNLRRLAAAIEAQTVTPTRWVIVDNGSEDDTWSVATGLAALHTWITAIEVPGEERAVPGAPIVRAFHGGLRELGDLPDMVVKLDADTSMESDHFEQLLNAFGKDPSLGIASGTCLELTDDGTWEPITVAAGHVRGAARAYRRECLQHVLPLAEAVGWDGIDGWKAQLNGWTTRMLPDLGFYHHRRLGARDGNRLARWRTQGRAAWFMGYRFSYLALRSIHRARQDPAALAMIEGFVRAAFSAEPRYGDAEVRAFIKRNQKLRTLLARHVRGRRVPLAH